MKRSPKILIITATLLLTSGLLLFTVALSLTNWDFKALSTFKYTEKQYDITEDFSDISVVSNTADIVFLPSENGKTSVICYDQEKLTHAVSVTDRKLSIEVIDGRQWYDHIGIGFESSKITIYLPLETYGKLSVKSSTGDLEISKNFTFEEIDITLSTGRVFCKASALKNCKIKTSTGDILTEDIVAGDLSLSVSTGNVTATKISCKGDFKLTVSTGDAKLTEVACKNLVSSGSTGNLSLKNVVASEKFSLNRSTGSITLEDSDAAELTIRTDTGDVTGSLLSPKIFVTDTATGTVCVPDTTAGGKCRISTSTGDISFWTGE